MNVTVALEDDGRGMQWDMRYANYLTGVQGDRRVTNSNSPNWQVDWLEITGDNILAAEITGRGEQLLAYRADEIRCPTGYQQVVSCWNGELDLNKRDLYVDVLGFIFSKLNF